MPYPLPPVHPQAYAQGILPPVRCACVSWHACWLIHVLSPVRAVHVEALSAGLSHGLLQLCTSLTGLLLQAMYSSSQQMQLLANAGALSQGMPWFPPADQLLAYPLRPLQGPGSMFMPCMADG